MTLTTSGPVAALDLSEPYGLLVTASLPPRPPTQSSNAFPFASSSAPQPSYSSVHYAPADSDPRVWDLCAGTPIGRLRGAGAVRALQVQGQACVTGGADGVVRVWDLSKVPDEEELSSFVGNGGGKNGKVPLPEPRNAGGEEDFVHLERESSSDASEGPETGCVRVLEGHSKAVTALYFEDTCMVSVGSWICLFLSASHCHLCVYELVRTLFVLLTFPRLGYRCVRQDDQTMGRYYWPVCPHDGHPVGDRASRWQRR